MPTNISKELEDIRRFDWATVGAVSYNYDL